MRIFLQKMAIYLVIFAGIHIIAGYIAHDEADSLYPKIASPPAKSLVIGSSRAAQGILPEILDSAFESQYDLPSFNFAFSHFHSRFGPVYLRAVRNKLDTSAKNGLFIVEIDPIALAANTFYPEDTTRFPENNTFLNTLSDINTRPNFHFLLQHYHHGWGSLLLQKFQNPVQTHSDGWIDVNIPDDYNSRQMRLGMKIPEYKKKYRLNSFSATRLHYFIQTITYLKTYGKVYLVRLPVHNQIYMIEKQNCPIFDSIIDAVCRQQKIEYLDYSAFRSPYNFTDGSHMTRRSARSFSKRLVHDINILHAQTTN